MIHLCAVMLIMSLLGLGHDVSAWGADKAQARIKILSPLQGTTIKESSVEVRYELAKDVHPLHVHCYVDGEYQRGFSGVVKGLSRGTHDIKVVAVGHDHQSTVAEAQVTIEVE